eukprot:CAMPEP_0201531828 /NCGR_PEP_ID=MMETSP0161_2-20130828/48740_1 /ASSEMBLY_ACC=CAM_ASM_000251 /TAXON_ID=180227 /ORGANISM="Neoparamoeba aestuarina, Strain SoJaBio B1-5/56/2" /LENGTH=164 /DNA_ID=CAMNT_0047934933 /DNA_START=163 /DNA_END=653 /DNA_ORIENTATION=-
MDSDRLNVLICGDAGVGKSTLKTKMAGTTKGVTANNGKKVTFELYEGQGNQKYWNHSGVVFVFDVTNENSFAKLSELKEMPDGKNVHWLKLGSCGKILVGNKRDGDRKVSEEKAKEWAQEMKMAYFEVNAQSGDNVDEAFTALANDYFEEKRKDDEYSAMNEMA